LRLLTANVERTPPGSDPLPGAGFRRLAYATIGLTFALVLVGGVVRISDSGLGCGPGGSGTKGWPLCGGRVVPLVDGNMIVEYSHRILAATLAITIGALALQAWRHYRKRHDLVRISVAAFGLVLFQAALGGLTVEKGLEEELVAAHLGVAMLQLGLLLVLARIARPSERRSSPIPDAGGPTRVLVVGALIAVFATIVAGGYMSANQLHGTDQPTPAVHTACGQDFPGCGGEFLPFGRSRELDIHLTHRAFMYLSCVLVLTLLVAVLRRRRGGRDPDANQGLVRATVVATTVLGGQVVLGALNVWLGEHAGLVIAHLALATVLWASLIYVSMLALPAPGFARAPARGAEAEAAPA
jgi:cytochrome c oxidase assembly protein subunit 15